MSGGTGRGRWVERIKEAWERARVAKEWRRRVEGGDRKGETRFDGGPGGENEDEIRKMAKFVVEWIEDCWRDV